MLLSWMELNAGNAHVFTPLLFEVVSVCKLDTASSSTNSQVFITKHLEIVLENIDQFIRGQSAFDGVGDSVDKPLKFVLEIGLFLGVLSNLLNEVICMVLTGCIHHSVKISLCAKCLHLVGSLQSNFEHFLLLGKVSTFVTHVLKVVGALSRILGLQSQTVATEISSFFGDADFDEGSMKRHCNVQRLNKRAYLVFLGFSI